MFAAPPIIATEVFARVPEDLRIRGRLSDWASVHRPGKPTHCFLEGPSFDRSGDLYTVDLAWGRIFRIKPDGTFSVAAEYDGQPNGLKIHRDGRIFVADRIHGILSLDPASGSTAPVVGAYEGIPFQGVNDLVFARNGDLYFTDQGMSGLESPTGRVFRYRANGTLEMLLDRIPSPNGLVLSREETTLYVNVTRDNAVWRIPMSPEGAARKVGAFIRLSGGIGPDGLAIDSAGNLAIAHLGLGVVWLVSPMGEPIARIQSCAGVETTNVAYGGPERRELYITESETGQILKATLPSPGWPMFSHG
ncbi:MAG TPA: SMP-30/gluconolactonase/LRE family protein [Opitutaceae bacterium]|jgi:gluconolactonase|nr:SMP-30/gluconolactonase/LRE family protein [Opitutaceae bacterium]